MLPVLYSDDFLRHDTGYGHPEKAQRLTSIVEALRSVSWADQITWLEPQSIEVRNPIPWVNAIHDPQYVESIAALSAKGGGRIDPDTVVSRQTYAVALLAVNAWLEGVDQVLARQSPAFVAARPPGHHAMPAYGMGFCIFNNVAIAAHYALAQPQIERVAILDWDVHHGNGTQAIAEQYPQIFYCSLHQSPYYPGTGLASETGEFGNILNVPMRAGSTLADYEKQMGDRVMPFLQTANPDLLLISAGYDANQADPLAEVNLKPSDYQVLMNRCLELTPTILLGLEGGYHCKALAESVLATLASCLKV